MSTEKPVRAGRRTVRAAAVPFLLLAIATASNPDYIWYRIMPGDTLSEIAARFEVSTATLVELNNLPGRGHTILAGERIKIPQDSDGGDGGGGGGTVRYRTVIVKYKVKIGDNLTEIAQRYRTKPGAILERNNLADPDLVRIGQVLEIPKRVKVVVTPSKKEPRYSKAVREAAARNREILAKRKTPSKSQTEKMIRKTAKAFGVEPSLALAIGWMESGWNQKAVSPANAIGVMQVLPSTGRWLETKLGRDLDLLDAKENIIAGVAYLRILTKSAPPKTAIAGYYQGPGSVRQNGMYDSTERYVRTVLALKKRFGG